MGLTLQNLKAEEPSHLKTFETVGAERLIKYWTESISPRRLCSYSRDKTAHGGAVLSEACLRVAGSEAMPPRLLPLLF